MIFSYWKFPFTKRDPILPEISSESGDSISLTEVLTLNVAPKSIKNGLDITIHKLHVDYLNHIS